MTERGKAVVRTLFVRLIRFLASILAEVHVQGIENVPLAGPAFLVSNHINAIEPLLLYTIVPRHVTALGKAEIWRMPLFGLVAWSLDAIPLHRGQLDLSAIRQALELLRSGGMLGVAPEGTRSHHGRLQRGLPGIVSLALRIPDAHIVPVATWGQEHLPANLLRLRRSPIHVVFGRAFHLKKPHQPPTREDRQRMVDEIMLQVAALLPSQHRGVYSDLQRGSPEYLAFASGRQVGHQSEEPEPDANESVRGHQ
jgi:1-acyl-sn-glycerol-3-phosphate acyltransferase